MAKRMNAPGSSALAGRRPPMTGGRAPGRHPQALPGGTRLERRVEQQIGAPRDEGDCRGEPACSEGENQETGHRQERPEDESLKRSQTPGRERPLARASHEGVRPDLHQHVEDGGAGGHERGSGDRGRKRGERDPARGRHDESHQAGERDHEGDARLRQLDVVEPDRSPHRQAGVVTALATAMRPGAPASPRSPEPAGLRWSLAGGALRRRGLRARSGNGMWRPPPAAWPRNPSSTRLPSRIGRVANGAGSLRLPRRLPLRPSYPTSSVSCRPRAQPSPSAAVRPRLEGNVALQTMSPLPVFIEKRTLSWLATSTRLPKTAADVATPAPRFQRQSRSPSRMSIARMLGPWSRRIRAAVVRRG